MRPHAGSAASAAIVIAAALCSPATAGADTIVARLARDTPIAAYGGIVAWSQYDVTAHRYRLVIRKGGATATLAVQPSARPFDVSLGPDARGRVVALYTRCRIAEHGCDVYRYDVAARRERRLRIVSSASQDEAWPAQWRDRIAFVRRGRVGARKCDVPYIKALSSRAAALRLARGSCAETVGLSLRATSIVQLTSSGSESDSEAAQVRRLDAGGRWERVLARGAASVNAYSTFVSPSQSASAVFLTRTGNRAPSDFLRIDLHTGKLTAVDPQLGLAGAVARDEQGTFWYVERPDPLDLDSSARQGFPPFCDVSPQPCALARASASPFSHRERTLPPQLTADDEHLTTQFAEPTAITGELSSLVVRGSRIVRRIAIAGTMIELATISANGKAVTPTRLTTLTDQAGRWTFTLLHGPSSALYAAVDRARLIVSGPVEVDTFATVSMVAAGRALTGAVAPAHPGRVVTIQRLKTDANGRPPGGCDPSGGPSKPCTEDRWADVAEIPLDAIGTRYAASVDRAGTYRAKLAEQQDGKPGYYGLSAVAMIA